MGYENSKGQIVSELALALVVIWLVATFFDPGFKRKSSFRVRESKDWIPHTQLSEDLAR